MQAFYFFNTNNVKYLFPDAFIDNISANSEQKCAENYNVTDIYFKPMFEWLSLA